MFAFKQMKETVLRVLLITVILFNALIPTAASASSQGDDQTTVPAANITNDLATSMTLGAPDSRTKEQVPILSEQIARQAQQKDEEKPVRFKVWADPAIYIPGKPITLQWKVQNLKSEDLEKAKVVIHAPEGLTSADPNATYTQDGLVTVHLQSKKNISTWNVGKEAEFPIYLGLDLLINDDLIASETILIDQAHFSVEKSKGGNLKSLSGKVEVEVPATAIDESMDFAIREPAPNTQPGVSLTWNPIEIIAVGKTSKKNVDTFKTPIKIKVKYEEDKIFDWDEKALTLYYYDPEQFDWFPIETIVDTKNNTLTAYSNHLTVFDYKANNWQSQMVPTVDAFKVSDFTGAGTYAINLWAPPGPGGLQPSLTLSYNSQVIDESSAFSQPSWVGMGWDLDTGSITRNMNGTDSDNGSVNDDTYSISVGGISGVLLPISTVGEVTTYNTADQSFMKVIGNNTTYSFTAWTQDGTKYIFSHPTSTNLSNPCSTSSGTPTTWRWSLSSVTDIHGNTLNYAYENERKPNCLNEVSVYPTTITYGNGKYQINFVREARTDYQTSWRSASSRTFHGTYRLKEVQIKHNGVNIRRYVMSYAPNNSTNIYPNFNWSAGGKTLTLVGVQEFGSDGSALPAVQFTYGDKMHITNVNNGQGGQVQLDYERWTYFDDINKDMRSLKTVFGTHECIPGVLGTAWTRIGTAGTVKCDGVNPYLQVGNNSNVHTKAERPLPEHMVKPGARYWYFIKGMTFNSTNTYPVYGFHNGAQVTTVTSTVAFNNSGAHEVDQQGLEMPVTYNPANTKLRLECRNCFFSQLEFILWPSIYRTVSRTITVQPTGTVSTYTYNYDNASPNSTDNSAATSYGNGALYTKILREFRGHAMTQVVNPEGLATVNWFYQTDSLKGRAYDTLTLKRDAYDDLNSGTNWNNTGGTLSFTTSQYQIDFDPAAKLMNTAANWNVNFTRTTATLTSGEVAVAHVRLSEEDNVTENNARGEVGLVENGGTFLGITLQASTGTATIGGNTLLTAGNFKKDEWYGVMFFLDANNGSRIRIWQLDNPANSGEAVVSGVGGGSWKMQSRSYDGTIWLDSYFEGTPYSETITRYNTTVQYDTVTSNGIPDLAPSGLLGFKDLQIAWNTVTSVEQRNYNGDARFVGTKQEFTYDTAANYGNLLEQKEYAWDNDAWTLHRGSKTEYAAPNTTAYIVSLPARQVTLDCTSGTCDFAGESGKIAESISFYDNNSSYTVAPTKGDVTRQRSWVQNNDYSQVSLGYDSFGNVISQTVYTGYVTAAQTGDPTGAQTTITEYNDGGYNTYPTKVKNALLQETTTAYNYAFGLPTSVTDPNGITTSATYDGFGRMVSITAPGDSSPTLQVTYHDTFTPFQIDLTQTVGAGASIRLSRFYDGAGRQIQTQTVGAVVNGVQKNVVVDTQYNNTGRMVKQSVPNIINYNAAPVFATQNFTQSAVNTYDILGRTLFVTQPNGNQISYEYADLSITVKDPKLAPTTSIMDVWGHTTRVIPPEGPELGYVYDVSGQLTKAIRGTSTEVSNCLDAPDTNCAPSKTTIINYDVLGRKLNMDDPDMGTWDYEYDALGNLKVQTDARGCVLSLDYDDLNRLESKSSSGDCGTQINTTYAYDAGVNGVGRRTGMADDSGSATWSYDSRGRVLNEVKTINGAAGPFTTSWTYNSADLPVTMTYPDGEVLTYGYNSDGALNTVTSNLGGSTYLGGMKYDESARITSMDYGAGIMRKVFTYFPYNTADQGGLLNSAITTRLSNQTTIQSFAYSYDENANVETITDNLAGPQSQTFTYDLLNRLTSADADGGTNGLYNESYEYSASTGNLSMKAGVTYTYSNDHPHAVESLSNGNSYDYDENGNMIARAVDGDAYDLAYDAENRLVSVSTGGIGYMPSGVMAQSLPHPNPLPVGEGDAHLVSYNPRPHQQSSFPSTTVLDNFNRADGSIGSNWSGATSSYDISSNQLLVGTVTYGSEIYWNPTSFGTDQEAYFTFTQVSSSANVQGLGLKAQSNTGWGNGLLAVMYVAPLSSVQVMTYTPAQGWVQRGSNISATFSAGDQFGARARADGTVEVYKNGSLLGTRDVTAWPYYNSGGYIGMGFVNANGAKVDDFGGGNVSTGATNTPVATNTPISSPTGTITPTPSNTPISSNTPLVTDTASVTNTPTSVTSTPTNTPTPTFFTPTPTSTASFTATPTGLSCSQVYHGPITFSGATMSMVIYNSSGAPLSAQDVTVTWNHDTGSQLGGPLTLNGSHLDSRFHWTGNVTGPTFTYIPSPAMTIPVGVSTIGFKFNYAYANPDGTERIQINFSTPGCEAYPFDSDTPAVTPTPTVTPTNPPTPSAPPSSVFSNAAFTYDGDGKRVKSEVITDLGSTTTYFVGGHYEIVQTGTSTQVNKYYYAGSQRIVMRSDGTLFFMLGDHLGSTSLVTFGNGNVVSETRYTAWGEIRYSSGLSPTDYTYTGQFSYTADFGLMYYNARWYDSSLGRFAQADSIIPGGVQGLDRYAYGLNNPIAYIDPSGHIPCEYYAGNNCTPPDPVSLTNPGDVVPGTGGGTQSYGGTQVKELYDLMQGCTTCWWYNNGTFTIETFLGLMAMAEGNYLQGDAQALDAIKQIFAQRLYVGGGNGDTDPYCPPGTCYNGIFNYLAAHSGSVWKLINAFVIGKNNISGYMGPGSVGQYENHDGGDQKIKEALDKAVELGHYAINPSVLYGRKEGPSEYGFISGDLLEILRTNNIKTNHINDLASNTFYLYFGDGPSVAAYFSINQRDFWLNEINKKKAK